MPIRFLGFTQALDYLNDILDGKVDIATGTIPFTKNQATRKAAAYLFATTINCCRPVLTADAMLPLATKLLIYLSRTGRQDSQSIYECGTSTLVNAIKLSPHLVPDQHAGIEAILRKYRQHQEQERKAAWLALPINTPPRTVLWSSSRFSIEETTDPRHLIADSEALGHCVGRALSPSALIHHALPPEHPDTIHFLAYWLKIKRRQARIITLLEYGMPRVTLHYDIAKQEIAELSGAVTFDGRPTASIRKSFRNVLALLPSLIPLTPKQTAKFISRGIPPPIAQEPTQLQAFT